MPTTFSKTTRGTSVLFLILSGTMLVTNVVFARGGGGGSGGGGGGGGGFSGGSGGSGGGSLSPLVNIIVFVVVIVFAIIATYTAKKQLRDRDAKEKAILEAEHIDAVALRERARDIFYKFQEAWSKFDLVTMEQLLTPNYYKRMVLELNVLKNEGRADLMEKVQVGEILVFDVKGDDHVVMRISASAQDILMDTVANRQLFSDKSSFSEFWHFVRDNDLWRLDLITQETENPNLVEGEIKAFAEKNGFYFDPDFGWLMMPNKGVIFGQSKFGTSDINNHVIGYFRDKIVEFYTYIPNPRSNFSANYLVAQTVLPKSYINILVRKKRLVNLAPSGLVAMRTESGSFDDRFRLYADKNDQISSLELLTPNFMEKIYGLPFELNIEIVGSFLYFYTKARGAAHYNSMLEVISWAFDEMKM